MADYFGYFVGSEHQGLTLVSALLVLLLLSSIGGAICGRNRTMEADVFIGWGAVTILFTVATVFSTGPLGFLSWGFFGIGLACSALLLRRDRQLLPPGIIYVLILLSPLLLIAAAMEPSQWDEFSHWLSAPRSLFLSNDVPSSDNPPQGTSMLAAYPYGWPYLTFLASRTTGIFMDGAGRIFNVVFLALFGLLALKVALDAAGHKAPPRFNWRLAGLATFFIAVINPTFIQKIILTAYADTGTSVALGITAYLLWILLDAEADGDGVKATKITWQATFVAAALINIKQVNLILLLGLVISFLIAAWRDPDIRLTDALRRALGVGVLPLLVYAVWRYHVTTNMSAGGNNEALFMPFEQWNVALTGQIFLQMLIVASKKFAFFAVMAVATAFAIVAFFRPSGRYGRLAILGGGTFVAYNAFLLFTYVSSFDARAAAAAVSYWRYNTHLGMIAVLMIAAATGLLWKRWKVENRLPKKATWLPLILVVAAPFIFAHKLRFDLEPNKPHYIAIAKEIAATVPNQRPLAIVDPMGNGESAVIARYITERKGIDFISSFQHPTLPNILRAMRINGENSLVLVHSVTPEMQEYYGDRLTSGSSYLLEWGKGENDWRVLKEWPYPG